MGCSTEVVCITCRHAYYCGSGSTSDHEQRAKRFPAKEHEGHEYWDRFEGDFDYIDKETGDLYLVDFYGGIKDEPDIVGYARYEQFDVSNNPMPAD